MKCPCEECISLAICRHKPLGTMLQCVLITNYHKHHMKGLLVGSHDYVRSYRYYRRVIMEIMKPTMWKVDSNGRLFPGSYTSYSHQVKKGQTR